MPVRVGSSEGLGLILCARLVRLMKSREVAARLFLLDVAPGRVEGEVGATVQREA